MRRWLLRIAFTGVLTHALCCEGRAQIKLSRLEGQVISDLDEHPLRRAHVTLRPTEAGLTSVGAEADDKGNFDLRDIPAGRYSLIAERDGYLATSVCLKGALRMPPVFSIGAGQSIRNLTFRLRPWAVITGKIRFEDGDPAVRVAVAAYREYHVRGRHGYSIMASAATDDHGEYRMHGLQPGSYLVAAIYERAAGQPGYREQARVDEDGKELPAFGYTTTFFPNTVKLSEAVGVRLDYGRESGGIDIFLRPIRKVKIQGVVISGRSGAKITNASIFLDRMDAHNNGVVPAPAAARFDQRTSAFEIKDVTPGLYLMRVEGADDGVTLSTRVPLTVPEQDIESVELLIKPQRRAAAKIRIEGGGKLDPKNPLTATLEPRSEHAVAVKSSIGRDSFFDFWLNEAETYDVYVQNLPDDFYLSEVRVNGLDMLDRGVAGYAPSFDNPLELVLDSRGGKVGGRVVGADETALSGASLLLVPDPAQGRLQSYREGYADEYGQFQIRGVAPGKYVLLAWMDTAPCDAFDVDNLEPCRAAGIAVNVSRAGQENVTVTVKTKP
jgi:Carboxypeptidase regulatory-like domain